MVFVPCLNARWVYGHLPLEVCIAKFRFVVHCCSFIMPRSQTRVAQLTTHLVHLASAVSLRDGDLVGELIAEWAISSPHARRQFAVAVRLAQPSCVREIQQGAFAKYASEVLPPDECCELILNLRAPKSAWRTLSEVYTLQGLKCTATTGLPFARPFCPERAFQQRWQDLLAPLELAPAVSTSDSKATGISWPWASWLRYIASQPPLCRMIDRSFPLTFIVRGDGYPCAGGEWSQWSVSIAGMGLWGRIPACVWVIGLAICGDKAMATLATLWEDNIKVCRAHTVLFRRRSDNLFRRRSGDVQVFRWNRHRSNLVPTKLMFFF